MSRVYIINNVVEFHAEQHLLIAREGSVESVILNTPASRCLHLLIKKQHSIVSQQEFFDEVWSKHGACVSANTFYQNISILRRGLVKVGLGDEIVKTVARRGLTLTASTTISVIDKSDSGESNPALPEQVVCPSLSDDKKISCQADCSDEICPDQTGVAVAAKKVIFLTGMATLLVIMIAGYYLQQVQKITYFSHYQPVKMVGPCTFYTEKKFNNREWLLKFITANNIVCDAPQYAFYYLTTYKFSNRYSLIKCNKDINKVPTLNCVSFYALQKKQE